MRIHHSTYPIPQIHAHFTASSRSILGKTVRIVTYVPKKFMELIKNLFSSIKNFFSTETTHDKKAALDKLKKRKIIPLHANSNLIFDLKNDGGILDTTKKIKEALELIKAASWVFKEISENPEQFPKTKTHHSHIKGDIKVIFCSDEDSPTGAHYHWTHNKKTNINEKTIYLSTSAVLNSYQQKLSSRLHNLFFELGNASQTEQFSHIHPQAFLTGDAFAEAIEKVEYETEKITYHNLTELYQFLKRKHPFTCLSYFSQKPELNHQTFQESWKDANKPKYGPNRQKSHADFYRDFWNKVMGPKATY